MATNGFAPPIDEQEEGTLVDAPDLDSLAVLNRSEINQQIATAKAYPRSIAKFRKEAFALITLDEETAAACIYALPRGKEKNPETGAWEKKIVKGPTARLGEIIAYSWGNCRSGARVISEDESFVTAQGMFYDLERNVAISYEVKRRIIDKDGNRYNADMIGMTANAACSIALRNAVFKGIPKALWKGLFNAAEQTIMGTIETLTDRREKLIALFKPFGVTSAMLCTVLGVEGVSEISLEYLVILRGMLTALQEGDSTVEQMFKTDAERTGERAEAATKNKVDSLKERYVKPSTPPVANPQPPSQEATQEPATAATETGTPSATEPIKEVEKAQEHLRRRRGQAQTEAQGSSQPTGSELFGDQGGKEEHGK